jgi:carboxyl-terminal processing protease
MKTQYRIKVLLLAVLSLAGIAAVPAQSTPARKAAGGETVSASQLEEMRMATEGSMAGIGAQLAVTNGALTITRIMPGGPAAGTNLQAGCQITAINGIATSNIALNDAVKLIRGPIGTEVRLDVREPDGAVRSLTLTRAKVVLTPVEGQMLEDGLLVIKFDRFNKETPGSVRSILDNHSAAKSLVLDLRANGGGSVDVIKEVAGFFLPKDSYLWTFQDTSGRQTETHSGNNPICRLPMAVLVNQQTASGGELFISAMQFHHRGVVIGQSSSGLAMTEGVRMLVNNPDGSATFVKRGSFVLERSQTMTNVVPDRVLPPSASQEDYLKAARQAVAEAGKANSPSNPSKPAAERLKQVKALFEQGLISKEDYDRKVKEIMDSL